MIKINLTPEEELRSPLWWVPEVVVLVVIAFASNELVNIQLDGLRTQVAEIQSNIEQTNESISSLKPKIEKYKDLDSQINSLNSKIEALKGITVSIINRFRPIIILEHLQNIKPSGVWFNSLSIKSQDTAVDISGESLHYLLVSEYLTGLKATSQGETDPSDLRTQVYFDDVNLIETKMAPASARFKDLSEIVNFSVKFKYSDRRAGPAAEKDMKLSFGPSQGIVNF